MGFEAERVFVDVFLVFDAFSRDSESSWQGPTVTGGLTSL